MSEWTGMWHYLNFIIHLHIATIKTNNTVTYTSSSTNPIKFCASGVQAIQNAYLSHGMGVVLLWGVFELPF